MKILNLKEFREQPSGTVFSIFKPSYTQGVYIKHQNVGNMDFWFQEIRSDDIDAPDSSVALELLVDAQEKGTSCSLDFSCISRWATHDETELFAVWEKEDMANFLQALALVVKRYFSDQNEHLQGGSDD